MDAKSQAAKSLTEWIKGQPFNNVLVIAQLCVMSYLGWYGMNVLIPSERTAISEFGKQIEEHHTKQVQNITATYEKMLDRIGLDERPQQKNGAIANK